jgi:membrane-associated PAP2 superfamily phosphatase
MSEPLLTRLDDFLGGCAVVSLLVIALFFIKFWRQTRDRLFLFFAGAFLGLMMERLLRSAMFLEAEMAPFVYSVRLAAFVLIIVAIIDKNRRS